MFVDNAHQQTPSLKLQLNLTIAPPLESKQVHRSPVIQAHATRACRRSFTGSRRVAPPAPPRAAATVWQPPALHRGIARSLRSNIKANLSALCTLSRAHRQKSRHCTKWLAFDRLPLNTIALRPEVCQPCVSMHQYICLTDIRQTRESERVRAPIMETADASRWAACAFLSKASTAAVRHQRCG